MKKLLVCLSIVMLAAVLAGCCLSHEWVDATCTSPRTCAKCGETEGDTLPHTWKDATCTSPRTCAKCGETEGDTLPHTWKDATCIAPKTCSVCNTKDGSALGHTTEAATCTTPETCSVCKATFGEPNPHEWEWTITREAAYGKEGSKSGTCVECGETTTEQISALVPKYKWNTPITLELPLQTMKVGIYKNSSEYWIEMTCENMNTNQFLVFFTNSTSNWGFDTHRIAERLLKVLDMYDNAWQSGSMIYASMEGYGIKWTIYLEGNENKPSTVGVKVNKLNEFTAIFTGEIVE